MAIRRISGFRTVFDKALLVLAKTIPINIFVVWSIHDKQQL